jgi:hypothetical protein
VISNRALEFAEHLTVPPQRILFEKCLHILHGAHGDVAALKCAAQNRGYHWFNIDEENVTSQRDFLIRVGEALAFPKPSGQNWDAFEERLKDLTWLPGRWYVLLLQNVDAFVLRAPEDFRIVVEILISVSDYWWERRVPFHVFITGGESVFKATDREEFFGRICLHTDERTDPEQQSP